MNKKAIEKIKLQQNIVIELKEEEKSGKKSTNFFHFNFKLYCCLVIELRFILY